MQIPEQFEQALSEMGLTVLDQKKFCESYNRLSTLYRYFLGVWTEKNSFDAWTYQEILFDKRPDLVIECGSFKGGSAWYLAHILDMIGCGHIVSIELRDLGQEQLKHPRITWLRGSTIASAIVQQVRELAHGKSVMVILDSDHTAGHVLQELNIYHQLVTPGQYLIVEDTLSAFSSSEGPHAALDEWLPKHPEFTVNKDMNRGFLSSNFNGYLLRS